MHESNGNPFHSDSTKDLILSSDIPKGLDDRSNFGSVLAEQLDPSSGEMVSRGIIHKASNQTCSYLALFLILLQSTQSSGRYSRPLARYGFATG